jgi:hypothetical protein
MLKSLISNLESSRLTRESRPESRGQFKGGRPLPAKRLELPALDSRWLCDLGFVQMRLPEQESFDDPGSLLALLTDDSRQHWPWSELQLQMGWLPERLDDALAELERDGLAHRHDGFFWATRAATRTRELLA